MVLFTTPRRQGGRTDAITDRSGCSSIAVRPARCRRPAEATTSESEADLVDESRRRCRPATTSTRRRPTASPRSSSTRSASRSCRTSTCPPTSLLRSCRRRSPRRRCARTRNAEHERAGMTEAHDEESDDERQPSGVAARSHRQARPPLLGRLPVDGERGRCRRRQHRPLRRGGRGRGAGRSGVDRAHDRDAGRRHDRLVPHGTTPPPAPPPYSPRRRSRMAAATVRASAGW